ncbi:transglycosylase SLT domain-containing protein [Paraburkholderia sp. EG304]|uniref:transglycosylase SLT domain-containing protein n=1 Tax=Paraburkholderia sp. EG304 TaxID=3237015 RepID=UPI003979F8E6
MAAKSIEFTISAVDKATATVNRVNRTIARMTQPYANLAKSAQRFAKASGIDKVSKDLGNVAKNAQKAAGSILKMGAPLLAIVGGGTIAGMTEMVTQWERMGAEAERTSRLLGITANQLTTMRGAATLMGVSSESMTAGFQQLQDTLQDARWGRNQAAYSTLQALGIKLKQTKDGTIDTRAAMGDLADVFQRIQKRDPAAARNLARNLGVEQLLPVLVQGRAALDRYEREAQRLRGTFTPEMAARAQEFTQSISGMGLAIDGLKSSISDRLAPVLRPVIERITEWIVANRDMIAQNVGQMVSNIADAVSKLVQGIDWPTFIRQMGESIKGVAAFAVEVVKVIDALGGFKTVATAVAVFMAGSFLTSVVSSIGTIATVLRTLTAVMWANPLLAALGAISLAVYEVVTHFDELKKIVTGLPAFFSGLPARLRSWLGMGGPTAPAAPAQAPAPAAGTTATPAGAVAAVPLAAGAPGAAGAPPAGAMTASVAEWSKKLGFANLEKQNGLPAGTLAAVAQVESGGNAAAVSPKGAMGLFQFMPATAREYGINAMDPAQAAGAAARKLGGLLQHYHGDLRMALAAYNWGEGNLDRKGMGAASAETRAYGPKVLAAMGGGSQVAPLPSLNVAPPQNVVVPAPVVTVSNQFHYTSNGQASVRTETPSGLKIERSMPSMAG